MPLEVSDQAACMKVRSLTTRSTWGAERGARELSGFYQDLQGDPPVATATHELDVETSPLKDEPLETLHVLKRYVTQQEGEQGEKKKTS